MRQLNTKGDFIFMTFVNRCRQQATAADNAQAESFFSHFKTELIEGGIFESIEQARSEIYSYLEVYYNRIRRLSSLGYLSPMEFEKQLKIKNDKE